MSRTSWGRQLLNALFIWQVSDVSQVCNIEWDVGGILGDDDDFLSEGMGYAHLVEYVGILTCAVTNDYRGLVD